MRFMQLIPRQQFAALLVKAYVAMKRKCIACGCVTLGFPQLIRLGLGFRAKCGRCGVLLERSYLWHYLLGIGLVFCTIFLLVLLGNVFGFVGIAMALVIPLLLEIFCIYWIPLTIVEQKPSGKEAQ